MKYVFTFGSAHHTVDNTSLAGRYCEIEAATREDARTLMFIARNRAWAFDYPNQEAAGVDKWALRPIDFSQVSLLEPADTAVVEKLRQSGFRFQHTVFKEDDGWYAWLPDPTLRRCRSNADKMQAIGVHVGRFAPTARCQYTLEICGAHQHWYKLSAYSLTAEVLLKDYEHLKRTLSDAWNAIGED